MTVAVFARQQYQLIRESREVLLTYCERMSADDFVKEGKAFAKGGSVRHLLVHIANCYEHWILRQALQSDWPYTVAEEMQTVADCRQLFLEIDRYMVQFLSILEEPESRRFSVRIGEGKQDIDGFTLFTHTITHEFHHKGQILTLSRLLGYTPVDTDVIRS